MRRHCPGCWLPGCSWYLWATPRSPTTGSAAVATHVCAGREQPVTPARLCPARPAGARREPAARPTGNAASAPHQPETGVVRTPGVSTAAAPVEQG